MNTPNTKTRRKSVRPEIAVLLRLRRMLMLRYRGLTNYFDVAYTEKNMSAAARHVAERSGVSWSIHDLDYVVWDLRKKNKNNNTP